MQYNNLKINLKIYDDNKERDIVLLHGWGQNIEMMDPVAEKLQDLGRVIILDFPGFGNSSELEEVWGVDDYVLMLENVLSDLNCQNPIMIAHSFGCRVAIKYALKNRVSKFVFTGAAGVKAKLSLVVKLRIYTYKLLKKILLVTKSKKLEEFLKSHFGSDDYKNSSNVMRGTLVKVVNEDLTQYFTSITCPTILFWGKSDEATPLSDGKLMEKNFQDAALIEVEGTHYAYLENLHYFVTIIREFIR